MIANRYRLDREIGRGGMGAVWLGRDETLGRSVAMKRVGMMPGGHEPDLERAAREARLAASLNHPHVVAIYDLVHEDGVQWLVMEYVDGHTLAERIKQAGTLDPDEVGAVLGQCSEALAAAHAAGIVHRDVKPSNILITRDGVAKISDFGIARAEADAQLTQTGLVTGSPAYLAPEVASGGAATPAADVWSLGATAYQALEGKAPLEVEGNLVGALYRLVHEEPPRATAPGWLAPMMAGTTEKDPQRRWTMAQVRDFLADRRLPAGAAEHTAVIPAVAAAEPPDGTAHTLPIETAPAVGPGRPRRHTGVPWWAVAAVVGVVLLLVVAVLLANSARNGSAGKGGAPTTTPTARQTSTSPPAAPTHSAAELRTFIQDYLGLATTDPPAAFKELTPAFQAASGGIKGYRSWWDQVEGFHIDSFSADPKALTVSYDVTYTLRGAGHGKGKGKGQDKPTTQQSHVNLQLVDRHGTLLINGES